MPDFQRDPRLYVKIQALFAEVQRLQRGDLLTHSRIRELTGLRQEDEQWKYVITRVKRLALNGLGIELFSERGEGYRLLRESEHVTVAAPHYRKRAYRQTVKVNRTLVAVADSPNLSEAERRSLEDSLFRDRRALNYMRATMRRASAMLRPTGAVS